MLTGEQKAFLRAGIAQIGLSGELTSSLISAGMIGPCGILLWQHYSDIPIYEYLGISPEEYEEVCNKFNAVDIPYKDIKSIDRMFLNEAEANWIHGLIDNVAPHLALMLGVHYAMNTIEDYLEFRESNSDGYKEIRHKFPVEVVKLDLILEQFGQSRENNNWRSIVCTTE